MSQQIFVDFGGTNKMNILIKERGAKQAKAKKGLIKKTPARENLLYNESLVEKGQ